MSTPLQRLAARIGLPRFLRLVRFYPPYLGAGVRVRGAAPDLAWIEVELPLRPWNQNYLGTQFGGSLYSMCDPWFVFLLVERLGPGWVVWDKAATIRFVRPGRGTVRARFSIEEARLAGIREEALAHGKSEPTFQVSIIDDAGRAVAELEKVLHVRPPRGSVKVAGG